MIPFRETYRDIPLYSPAKKPCRVDLSDNTNLFGAPPSADRVLREEGFLRLARYPAGYAPDLKRAVATYAGVSVENVTTGCGSDDVIDCALRAFLEPGDAVAFPDPTFVMVPMYARLSALKPVPVPLRADHDLDVNGLLATGAKLIYVCTPNNPTGTVASRAAVERLVDSAPGVVLIDQAYVEFTRGGDFLDLARTRPNVLVTRTMSKAFGLAGLRVGWGVGAPSLVAEVEKARGPYKHTALGEAVAVAALTDDVPWMEACAAEAVENRERLRGALKALGLEPLPSEGNFLLVPMPEARRVGEALRERNVNVRVFEGLTGVGDALRIGCGPWPMVASALKALKEVL
ncbi:aminotransferase class I/II-fold pyridoxal phosphate-dependent enzyme [Corallococcus sp. AB030]|uniref:pyridoxal phosphate-dependent aminotransferase n=1 Tax=unclassified Corallococcus TaxID=2685029 RepID=UPI000ED2218E|nr:MULTISPECIES: aminotransferase class I/II-fold pyridoxal phosphate-dependent enzyme [unclassified Corallococcus]RKI11149.1 aminotransferase class I/II-fold pyridoxal phosphate-dependent enzyme [Corallococcus sp. AB030]RUO91411.1 aminotransferase class I/II-fold pyridoxal phosphate-dependent enzyme [Corallococcus sp. AB018]